MILWYFETRIYDFLESIDDLGDIVFLVYHYLLTIDRRITKILCDSILRKSFVSDRVLRDVSLFKQIAEARYELFNKFNTVMTFNILMHKVDDLI